MSMLLWINEAEDKAVELGNPLHVYRELAELARINDGYEHIQSLTGFSESEPDAAWWSEVRKEAKEALERHGEEVSAELRGLLTSLAYDEGDGIEDDGEESDDEPADDIDGVGERQFASAPAAERPIVIKNIINMPEPPAPAPVVMPAPVVLFQKGEKGEPGEKGESVKGEKGDKGDRGEAVVTVEQVKAQPPKPFQPKEVIVHRDEVSGEVDVLRVREVPKKPVPPAEPKE